MLCALGLVMIVRFRRSDVSYYYKYIVRWAGKTCQHRYRGTYEFLALLSRRNYGEGNYTFSCHALLSAAAASLSHKQPVFDRLRVGGGLLGEKICNVPVKAVGTSLTNSLYVYHSRVCVKHAVCL